jgi:hypothetical protein
VRCRSHANVTSNRNVNRSVNKNVNVDRAVHVHGGGYYGGSLA